MSTAEDKTGGEASGGGLKVSEDRWRWLTDYCGLTDEDLALMAEAESLVELSAAVAESFYSHILKYKELRELIGSTTTIERLRDRLQDYYRSLFTGRFDDARIEELARIARMHDRIGLPFSTYYGATLRINRVVIPALVSRYHEDPEKLSAMLMAYEKLAAVDVAIVAQTFWETRASTTAALLHDLP